MTTDELFFDVNNLPKPLSEEELDNLIQKSKDGSNEARDKILVCHF